MAWDISRGIFKLRSVLYRITRRCRCGGRSLLVLSFFVCVCRDCCLLADWNKTNRKQTSVRHFNYKGGRGRPREERGEEKSMGHWFKHNTLIHKINFVLGKHTFSQYRQPKQPTAMADIETIDTRNREVICLYNVLIAVVICIDRCRTCRGSIERGWERNRPIRARDLSQKGSHFMSVSLSVFSWWFYSISV
jgi:hypothetical protein